MARSKLTAVVTLTATLTLFGWTVFNRLQERGNAAESRPGPRPVPVEVAPIQRGPIVLRRTFNGALEARAQFVVAPKVGGRIEELMVDLADTVTRGQVVAKLDSDEYVQAMAQAEADLVVAKANVTEAE
ncbi:MAG: biotin/lipoyl-binding protein, partial [Desulfobacterales bacterium]|nr:biotin/lipoyl-binding protein [Desulfobacterales bacterium]